MGEIPGWAINGVGLIAGALGAYYGARNAMQERLARLEATQGAHADDIADIRKRSDYAHERINRILEAGQK